MKKIVLVSILLVGCLVFWGMGKAEAVVWNLSDANSTLTVNDATSIGASQWNIDGFNNLFQYQYWYRVGNVAEQPITNLPLTSAQIFGTKLLTLVYQDPSVKVEVNYLLTGGAVNSHTSDMATTLVVTNKTQSSMDFHLFKYTDFDIYSNVGFDIATIKNVNTIRQSDQFSGFFEESVFTPQMDLWEIAFFTSLRDKLDDGNSDNLLNLTSPLAGGAAQFVTWATQWDRTIASGGSFTMSEDNNITEEQGKIPEPISLILLGSGLAGVGLYRRLRKPRG